MLADLLAELHIAETVLLIRESDVTMAQLEMVTTLDNVERTAQCHVAEMVFLILWSSVTMELKMDLVPHVLQHVFLFAVTESCKLEKNVTMVLPTAITQIHLAEQTAEILVVVTE
jgi:hypothetical protein